MRLVIAPFRLALLATFSDYSRAMSAQAAREFMYDQIKVGASGASEKHSGKSILARGCDPAMAKHSESFLPPLLGGAQVVGATDDDTFFALLKSRQWDVVFFAPGACRWNAAKKPIPGGNRITHGWGLDKYRAVVREHQGEVPIVESTEEKEIVPLLRAALAEPSRIASKAETG